MLSNVSYALGSLDSVPKLIQTFDLPNCTQITALFYDEKNNTVLICDRKVGILRFNLRHSKIVGQTMQPFLKPVLAAKFTKSLLILGANYRYFIVGLDLNYYYEIDLNPNSTSVPACLEITNSEIVLGYSFGLLQLFTSEGEQTMEMDSDFLSLHSISWNSQDELLFASGRNRQGLLAVISLSTSLKTSITIFAVSATIGNQLNTRTTLKCCNHSLYLLLNDTGRYYELSKDGLLMQNGALLKPREGRSSSFVDMFDVFVVSEYLYSKGEKNFYLRNNAKRHSVQVSSVQNSILHLSAF